MTALPHRTKIVATLGPASNSPEVIKQLVEAGMNVARLNFSHGNYEDHAHTVSLLRSIEKELDTPVTILQDLQGPKIRVGNLPDGAITLTQGKNITLVPLGQENQEPDTVGIDYPYLAEEVKPAAQVLLDDGRLELRVESVSGNKVKCTIIEGGLLKSRKGVNFPSLNLRLPAMTDKDKQDLDFGLSQGVDWISLSFVRSGEDIRALKQLLAEKGADVPVIAKIEKPQAIANLEEIVRESDGIMVARGDLGVEMSPEKVPMLQKQMIRMCNKKGIPVITATQMLESMINEPRPTRAEASDVANAIVDGTDAVMLSGESAVGKYPIKAVEMMVRIARDVEKDIKFINYPPSEEDETHAISEALNTIDKILPLRCIVAFTMSGYTATLVAAERPKALVVGLTPLPKVFHRLNLVWGVQPVLMDREVESFEELIQEAEDSLLERKIAATGDQVLIIGGIPTKSARGTNFLKIHTIG